MDLVYDLLDRRWEVQVRRVSRQLNMVADCLARMMRGKPIGLCIYNTPPSEVIQLVQADLVPD